MGAILGPVICLLYQTNYVAFHPGGFGFADMGTGGTFLVALVILLPLSTLGGALLGIVLVIVMEVVVGILNAVRHRHNRNLD